MSELQDKQEGNNFIQVLPLEPLPDSVTTSASTSPILEPIIPESNIELIPKPAKSKDGQVIEYYIGEDGKDWRKYTVSGVIQRWNGKRWVFAPGTAKMTYTPETASEIAKTRWDNYHDAAMLGLMDATGTNLPNDAVRKITQIVSKHAIDGVRGGPQYLQHARELAGLVQDKRGDSVEPGTFKLSGVLTLEQLQALAGEAMRRKREIVGDSKTGPVIAAGDAGGEEGD